MVYTSSSPRRVSLLASAIAALGLLTACGGSTDNGGAAPQSVPGSAVSAGDDSANGGPGSNAASPAGSSASSASSSRSETAATASASGTRCHTSELAATVGRNNPGAGQENFPIVLTNRSGHTCTLRGYPGAAFVSGSGGQVGPDPRRSSGTPSTITLKPGQSAWAGLTFSNPGVSGARTAKPSVLLVTPPNERDPLRVKWTAGKVPVSGNASSVFLTVLSRGTGA